MQATASPAITHLLYLHGFRSSPQSKKARQFGDWVRAHRPDLQWWCPQLPPSPSDALALLIEGTKDWPLAHTAVVGSSLGGFYATVLAERWARSDDRPDGDSVRVALLNPAVHPARDLAAHIGETTSWHDGDRFFFRPEFIDELQQLSPDRITQPQTLLCSHRKGRRGARLAGNELAVRRLFDPAARRQRSRPQRLRRPPESDDRLPGPGSRRHLITS